MSENKSFGPGDIEIIPPKVGRPTNYDPAYCEQVIELGAKGKSRAQMAAHIGCSRQTMSEWEAKHPEFADATTRARDLALAWWEQAGQVGMFMKGFNANAFSLQIRNRFPEDYRDKKDHEVNLTTHEQALEKLK